ncbi:MAG: hypothetical protein AAF587_07450 [Bacteroidota bacterium]
MIIPKEHIAMYIPQRPPFVMIDTLREASKQLFISDFVVEEHNIFVDNGNLSAFALIENIAQTSAAGIGYLNQSRIDAPKDGFIGGISKLMIHELPKVGQQLITHVRLMQQLGHMYLLKGENVVDGRLMMECTIKLVGMIPGHTRNM